jgi:lipoate-protein ligase A
VINIINDSFDPYFNMAVEEYILTEMPDKQDYFMLWQNRPAVIIGRNQNTMEEINYPYIKERSIEVVRRLSGGGAVYHDYGNLNFTFVVTGQQYFANFEVFTRPVIKVLKDLGVTAHYHGRNDISIDCRKFSGNAHYLFRNRLLHHGTILFNSNIEEMVKALNPSGAKISSKGIKSVRSRVTNICEHLPVQIDIQEFKQLLTAEVMRRIPESASYVFGQDEIKAINQLRNCKYAAWEWVYGASPACNIIKTRSFSWGNIEARLDIKQGKIKNLRIYGDFFANHDISDLERNLVGTLYREDEVKKRLAEINLKSYLPHCSDEEFIALLFA